MQPLPSTAAPARQPTPAAARTRLDGEGRIPIRLAAVSTGQAGLVNMQTGLSAMVSVGQSFAGCALISVDTQSETAVVRQAGRDYVLRLSAGPEPVVTPPDPVALAQAARLGLDTNAASAGGTLPFDIRSVDISKLKPPRFEPTPEETAAGIDPNNPATWTAGYRGPGIERAAKEAGATSSAPGITLSGPLPATVEPTPGETSKGIDPNNANTWPANYRGPGIERALRESGQAAPVPAKKTDASMPVTH